MARIGGSRGRLVRDAVVLLLAVNSCRDVEAGESTSGGESHTGKGRLVMNGLRDLMMMIVRNGLLVLLVHHPSTD